MPSKLPALYPYAFKKGAKGTTSGLAAIITRGTFKKKGHGFCLIPLVHQTRCNHDTCPFSDMCYDHSESWTKAAPFKKNRNCKICLLKTQFKISQLNI